MISVLETVGFFATSVKNKEMNMCVEYSSYVGLRFTYAVVKWRLCDTKRLGFANKQMNAGIPVVWNIAVVNCISNDNIESLIG